MNIKDLSLVLIAVQSKIAQQQECFKLTNKQAYKKEAKVYEDLLGRLSQN